MVKYLFLFILGLFAFTGAFAQKDTAVYFITRNGKIVSTKDSADFFFLILPPDTSVDKKLFIVKEYYLNGKIRSMGNSITDNSNLKFQGIQIKFFENGHKMTVRNYKNGEFVGDIRQYYPNGKLYNITTVSRDREITLKECRDSTGNVLAANGNGKWINFLNERFDNFYVEGEIRHGLEEGQWTGKLGDAVNTVRTYKWGKLLSIKNFDLTGKDITYLYVVAPPEFPGGRHLMYDFIRGILQYPKLAQKNNTQGAVVIAFTVETDGALTDFRVVKSIGDGCDEEAIRVLKAMPKWKPAMWGGEFVKIEFEVPVNFYLSR